MLLIPTLLVAVAILLVASLAWLLWAILADIPSLLWTMVADIAAAACPSEQQDDRPW